MVGDVNKLWLGHNGYYNVVVVELSKSVTKQLLRRGLIESSINDTYHIAQQREWTRDDVDTLCMAVSCAGVPVL